jgi:hypothetical protein
VRDERRWWGVEGKLRAAVPTQPSSSNRTMTRTTPLLFPVVAAIALALALGLHGAHAQPLNDVAVSLKITCAHVKWYYL